MFEEAKCHSSSSDVLSIPKLENSEILASAYKIKSEFGK
jgi:hypothetical protein